MFAAVVAAADVAATATAARLALVTDEDHFPDSGQESGGDAFDPFPGMQCHAMPRHALAMPGKQNQRFTSPSLSVPTPLLSQSVRRAAHVFSFFWQQFTVLLLIHFLLDLLTLKIPTASVAAAATAAADSLSFLMRNSRKNGKEGEETRNTFLSSAPLLLRRCCSATADARTGQSAYDLHLSPSISVSRSNPDLFPAVLVPVACRPSDSLLLADDHRTEDRAQPHTDTDGGEEVNF